MCQILAENVPDFGLECARCLVFVVPDFGVKGEGLLA
jgi:hypothetical protein